MEESEVVRAGGTLRCTSHEDIGKRRSCRDSSIEPQRDGAGQETRSGCRARTGVERIALARPPDRVIRMSSFDASMLNHL